MWASWFLKSVVTSFVTVIILITWWYDEKTSKSRTRQSTLRHHGCKQKHDYAFPNPPMQNHVWYLHHSHHWPMSLQTPSSIARGEAASMLRLILSFHPALKLRLRLRAGAAITRFPRGRCFWWYLLPFLLTVQIYFLAGYASTQCTCK